MFSGVSDNPKSLYGAWQDLHTPFAKEPGTDYYEMSSLLNFENLQKTIKSCDINEIDYIGIKLLPLPSNTSIKERVGINRDALSLIFKAVEK